MQFAVEDRDGPDLTDLIDRFDLPGFIAERYPESGAKPNTTGSIRATWRGEKHNSFSLFKRGQTHLWRDHGTNESGNALQFMVKVLDMSESEAAEEIRRLADKTFSGGKTSNKASNGTQRRLVAAYDYLDAEGNLLFQAVRYEPKGFSQRRPDGKGGWLYNLQGVTPVLYRLPKVQEAVKEKKPIYLAEGEKDVAALEALFVTASCNPMGAGKWRDEYSETLTGAHVILLPDNDLPGEDHVRTVATSLKERAGSIRIVRLPDLPEKGDVTDWLATGKTLDDLKTVVKQAPAWQQGQDFDAFMAKAFGEVETWEDIGELPALVSTAPTLPAVMLPEPLRAWIHDAAERACVHLEFIAIPALASAGAVIGRKLGIHPKRHDDWLELPILWAAIVGPPSTLKSMALAEGTAPLMRLAAKAREAHEAEQLDREADKEVLKAKADKLRKQARSKAAFDMSGIRHELKDVLRQLQEADVPMKRYVTQDGTTEKLGALLNDNPNGLMVLRDELMGWLRALEKPGHETDRAFYLEAWNGKGAYTVDRIARGTLHVSALALTITGGIQPGRLLTYIRGAMEGEEEADGLLQRFQLLVWPDKPRDWRNVDRYPDSDAKRRAYEVFQALDALEPEAIGAEKGSFDELFALRFDDMAQELFNAWLDDLMTRLRSGEIDHAPAYQAHLAKYPALMARLSLVFHLLDVADGRDAGPISAEAAGLAINWCAFLDEHARKVYSAELNTAALSAHALNERIEAGDVTDGMNLRDIYRKQWSKLSTAQEVGEAVKLLEEANRVKLETVGTGEKGGRPSERIRMHPKLRTQ